MKSIIDDFTLAKAGEERLRWFREQMPLMADLRKQFAEERAFEGKKIGICLHVEPKTAIWIDCFLDGGAEHITIVGNLGTTKPDTAAFLAANPRITVYAKVNDTLEDHERYAEMVMEEKPDILLDNGSNLIRTYFKKERDWKPYGANEETRTGRLLIDDAGIKPTFPIIVIDDSPLKRLLENAIGVGQSVVDGFMRATSTLLGGKKVLEIGYGYVGSGIANKFRSMGANTMVYDIDPVYLLKAKADGHTVDMDLNKLIPEADVIITATGRFHIIRKEHIPLFKDGVMLCNAGHFGFEIDTDDLRKEADSAEMLDKDVEFMKYGEKRVFLLGNASPINLSVGTGNPIPIMDLGLGLQAMCAARHLQRDNGLPCEIQPVPRDIDVIVSEKMLSF